MRTFRDLSPKAPGLRTMAYLVLFYLAIFLSRYKPAIVKSDDHDVDVSCCRENGDGNRMSLLYHQPLTSK